MARISVVIPARDDAAMLAECLLRLARQTRPADEIVVVDNASTDDTASVARAGGARVVTEPLVGIPAAAAAGYDAARGELIARLDADSRPQPDWLERIEHAFSDDPSLDVVTGPGEFYGAGRLTRTLGRRLYIGGYFWAMGWWLGAPPVFGSNAAFRAQVWVQTRDRVHRRVREVHDDLDLSLHLDATVAVRLDRSLIVGVSARPFAGPAALGRRLSRAWNTLTLNLPECSPFRLRKARRLAASPRQAPGPTPDRGAARTRWWDRSD